MQNHNHLGKEHQPMIVLLDHDAPILMAILGVLKAGQAYVVLEPNLPPARFNAILADLQSHLIITNNQHWELATILASENCRMINLDTLDTDVSSENLGLSISPDTVAAIFYTSGSTGKTKGVQWTHRGILHRIWLETNDYHIHAEDKIVLLYSCGFAASVADVFNALLNGATICLYDFKKEGLTGLSNWLRQEAITMFHLPVALFQQWLNSLNEQEQFPNLRFITPSGKLYRKDVERCWQYFSDNCKLVQRYSSTEAGMCTRLIIDPQTQLLDQVVPIGYPISDKKIILLKDGIQPVTDDGIGEITVQSRYLSLGYWRNSELSDQKFLPDPDNSENRIYLTGDLGKWRSDGSLEYRGRKDFMVKIRGYRVEPSEVETALVELAIVQQAVVVADTEADCETCLIAYVVPAGQHSSLMSLLHQMLQEKVPNYMMPAAFIILNELPLTPNGKIDHRALPVPDLSKRAINTELVAPRSPVEEKLCSIWCDLLRLKQAGIHDNFFELGGNSLLATQVVSRIKEIFSVDLLLRNIFESPTVAELAREIEKQEAESNSVNPSALVFVQPTGAKIPLFFINSTSQAQSLIPWLDPDQPIYSLNIFCVSSLFQDYLKQPNLLKDIAQQFIQDLRTVQPSGPYQLVGYCQDGALTLEVAQQLQQQGETVSLLCLIDSIFQSSRLKLWHRLYALREFGWRYLMLKSKRWLPWWVKKLRKRVEIEQMSNIDRLKLLEKIKEDNKFYAYYCEQVKKYSPQPYHGRVALILSREWQFEDLSRLKNIAVKQLEIYLVKALHESIFTPFFVENLAKKIQECLRLP